MLKLFLINSTSYLVREIIRRRCFELELTFFDSENRMIFRFRQVLHNLGGKRRILICFIGKSIDHCCLTFFLTRQHKFIPKTRPCKIECYVISVLLLRNNIIMVYVLTWIVEDGYQFI